MFESEPTRNILSDPVIADYLRFSYKAIYESGLMGIYNSEIKTLIDLRKREDFVPGTSYDHLILAGLKTSLTAELPIIAHKSTCNFGGEDDYYLVKVDKEGDILDHSLVLVSAYCSFTKTKLLQNNKIDDNNELLVRELNNMRQEIGWNPTLQPFSKAEG